MGYSTEFKGKLNFKRPLSTNELFHLGLFLDRHRVEDFSEEETARSRKHGGYWTYTDLKITEDSQGLEWSGAEKTHELEHIVNWVTEEMQLIYPDFALEGKLSAKGEDFDDFWELVIEDGIAKKVPIQIKGKTVTCPHCDEKFILVEK